MTASQWLSAQAVWRADGNRSVQSSASQAPLAGSRLDPGREIKPRHGFALKIASRSSGFKKTSVA